MTDQLAMPTRYTTLDETFADWGPSYDAMIAGLEQEALEEAEHDQDLQLEPEFMGVYRMPADDPEGALL